MSDATKAAAGERLIEIRTVEIVAGTGRTLALSSVRCPLRGRTAPVEECAGCGGSAGVARDALALGRWLACRCGAHAARAGLAAAEGALVGDAMRPGALALRSGVARVVAADALHARAVSSAIVVDGEARPVGTVSAGDLLGAASGARVADVMDRRALCVREIAPLAKAASLMAEHRVDRLAVVAEDGALVGEITALDVVSWLAGPGGTATPSGAGPRAQRG